MYHCNAIWFLESTYSAVREGSVSISRNAKSAMFELVMAQKENFDTYLTKLIPQGPVAGNIVMVATDMCGNSPIVGEKGGGYMELRKNICYFLYFLFTDLFVFFIFYFFSHCFKVYKVFTCKYVQILWIVFIKSVFGGTHLRVFLI